MLNRKIQEAYQGIVAEESLKNNTKQWIQQERIRREQKHKPRPMLKLVAAISVFILLLGSGGAWFYFTPTAYITIDINPSIELSVNRLDRVIGVQGQNEDGDVLAASLDLKGVSYEEAFSLILEDSWIQSLLAEDAEMEVAVIGEQSSQNEQMQTALEQQAKGQGNIYCTSGSTELASSAAEVDLPLGKYKAYLVLKELDPSVQPQDLQSLPMPAIRDWIDSLQQEETQQEKSIAEESSQGEPQRNGNGKRRRQAHTSS